MVGGGGQQLAVAQRPSADSRTSPGTSWVLTTSRKSGPPGGNHTPHNRQPQRRAPLRRRPPLPAVRPAGPGGWRRPGRLHAPEAARTGPVSASRRSHVLMPRGGAGSTGKWPLTGFLAGESPNQTWGAMLTDLNGLKAVGLFWSTIDSGVAGSSIAQPADMPGGTLASAFVVGPPKTQKTPVLGALDPFRFCSCVPSICHLA